MSISNANEALQLGRLVRLRLLEPSEIPFHPILSAAQNKSASTTTNGATTTTEGTNNVALRTFITQVLTEGSQFIDKTIPTTSTPTNLKPSPPSIAKVQSSKLLISAKEILNAVPKGGEGQWGFAEKWRDEHWFSRRSVHKNSKGENGTADWSEFVDGLMRNHSVHEADYTPNVFDCREVCNWEGEGLKGESFDGWEEVRMNVYEMCHHIPFPIRNRTFSTLVVSAIDTSKTGSPSFILVQIPVNLTSVPTALYSTGANTTKLDGKLQKKKVVLGQYVSVERCKVVKGEGANGEGEVCWDMATASDARGWLPMFLQKFGVPGALVSDVGFFMKWVGQNRGRGEPKVTSGGAAS